MLDYAKFFVAPLHRTSRAPYHFWFGLSLVFAIAYIVLALHQAFASEFIVQDDARQHVFWMQRFQDPELFPNDLIADYFQSVAPSGYRNLYKFFANLGIPPLLFNKLLPPILLLVTTSYFFHLFLLVFPVPMASFLATSSFALCLYMKDDTLSATPRAFVYPCLVIFLYYLLKRSLLPCLTAIALTGLFYPQYVLVQGGILTLRWLDERDRWRFYLPAIAIAFFSLLPYALQTSEFGEVISPERAKTMVEFWPRGRSSFFHPDWFFFWVKAERSGFLPQPNRLPYLFWFGVLLPVFLCFPRRFPLLKEMTKDGSLLPQMLAVAIGLYATAHLALFKLHLPSRYMMHSLRVILAIATGIAIAAIIDSILHRAPQKSLIPGSVPRSGRKSGDRFPRTRVSFLTFCFFLTAIAIYPLFLPTFPKAGYKTGTEVAAYQFFKEQPKDILIASIAEEGDDLPSFSQRSILTSWECAIPYHTDYYRELRHRTIALIEAQYSPDPAPLQKIIQTYGIDFFLLHRGAFAPEYLTHHDWIKGLSLSELKNDALVREVARALEVLNTQQTPALARVAGQCTVLESNATLVLDANCIDRELTKLSKSESTNDRASTPLGHRLADRAASKPGF